MLTNTFAKIKFKCLSSFLDSLSPSRYSFLHLNIINQDDLFRRNTVPPLYHPHNLRSKIVYFLLNTDAPSSSLPGDAARLTAKGFVSTLKVPVGRTHPCCHIAKDGTTPTFPLSHIGAHIDCLQNCHQFWWISWIFANVGDFFIEIFSVSLKFSLFLVNNFSQIFVRFSLSKMSPILVTFLQKSLLIH